MAIGRIGKSVNKKLMMLLYGNQFTGKSTLASQLAYFKRPDGKPFRILYIDAESGSIDFYLDELEADGIDTGNIYFIYTQALSEVKYYIEKVRNQEDFYVLDEDGNETDEIVVDADGEPFRADAIVIDGTTVLNFSVKSGLVEFSQKRNAVKAKKREIVGDERFVMVEGAGLELKDYDKIQLKGQDLVLDLLGCGVHCIITARETDEKVSVKDSEGKITSISTGKKIPEGFKKMGHNVHTEIRLYRDEKTDIVCAKILKDRTHAHADGEILENPTLLDWKKVIESNANRENFVLKNSFSQSIKKEQKMFEKEVDEKINNINLDKDDTSSDNDNSVTFTSAKKNLISKMSTLSPEKKKVLREKIENAGYPTAISKINDIATITAIQNLVDSL